MTDHFYESQKDLILERMFQSTLQMNATFFYLGYSSITSDVIDHIIVACFFLFQ